jgi:hypothetical protein
MYLACNRTYDAISTLISYRISFSIVENIFGFLGTFRFMIVFKFKKYT